MVSNKKYIHDKKTKDLNLPWKASAYLGKGKNLSDKLATGMYWVITH